MKIRKELRFGFGLMAIILAGNAWMLLSVPELTNGHLGLTMLALVVVAIMLGFPTAFTLMGMGMIFTWLAYARDTDKTLTLMVQSAFKVMGNDVLISIPLFVFMGYLVERANLIEKLFKSLHLALARVPGSLAVATLFTCAVFATATGIVGAVVTLMGLLAMPQMLRAGYDVRMSAGAITAGGCLGILIPPSVMLIVYGATAGVSVVQLYAGAFFPGIMLAGLYVVYVIIMAKLKPEMAPPLSAEQRIVPLPPLTQQLNQTAKGSALAIFVRHLTSPGHHGVPASYVWRQLGIALLPLVLFALAAFMGYRISTAPVEEKAAAQTEMQSLEASEAGAATEASASDLAEPSGLSEPSDLAEPPGSAPEKSSASDLAEPPGAETSAAPAAAGDSGTNSAAAPVAEPPAAAAAASEVAPAESVPASNTYWIGLAISAALVAGFYAVFTLTRLEIFKLLLSSFFPLLVLILAVLGSIVFGLATPTEAAAVGALGGALLAAAYGRLKFDVVRESVFLTAKTSAMVCWLFVGSAIFSAAFALLGGQELVEQWVLSMNLSKTQFLILSQVIIFVLGWPLEWTEIIVIFMPIFIPLLDNFGVDPLFFGLLVALNLQTAFLSPPVAMAAFYLKGVSPPHVTLNQIFAGMIPFMGIQVVAIVLLYIWPEIGLWLPQVLYK